jgi:hypothetical protein
MKLLFVIAVCLATTAQSFACIGGKGYLPQNKLFIGVNEIQGINQTDFNDVLDKISSTYSSEIARYGGNLKILRKWSDGTVNALARREGRDFVIEMFGGLARHSSITKDAFTLVACHEIGHHIGGAPHYSGAGNTWASSEGQSDYFATIKCLKKVFSKENNEQIVSGMTIPKSVEKECKAKFSSANDQAICKRISMAGFSSASMSAVSQNAPLPKFDTPDPGRVPSNYESHPQYQCRLDTYFNGAVCDISEDIEIGQTDPNVGVCNRADSYDYGLRPLCWFKPQSGNGNPDPTPTPGGVAPTPSVNGQTTVASNNPNTVIPLQIDLRSIQGAAGFGIEVSKPNQQFLNPNGSEPDRQNGLFLEIIRQPSGVYSLNPSRQLPSWGVYQIRIIVLDSSGNAISKNSNPFVLSLRQ